MEKAKKEVQKEAERVKKRKGRPKKQDQCHGRSSAEIYADRLVVNADRQRRTRAQRPVKAASIAAEIKAANKIAAA